MGRDIRWGVIGLLVWAVGFGVQVQCNVKVVHYFFVCLYCNFQIVFSENGADFFLGLFSFSRCFAQCSKSVVSVKSDVVA